MTDRGRGEVEALSGGTKMPFLPNYHKYSQQIKVEV
jgi:hypothetical protein